jgi:hypothetical protein
MSDLKISCLYIVKLVVFHSGCHEEKGKFPGNPNIATYIWLECKILPLWLEHNDMAFTTKFIFKNNTHGAIYLQAVIFTQCNIAWFLKLACLSY